MSAEGRPLRLLLLCDYVEGIASTIIDHIRALEGMSRHEIDVLSFRKRLPWPLDFDRYDGIILHYSLVICYDSYIDQRARQALRDFRGLKIAIIQDEYRFIDATVAALADIGIHGLLTCITPDLMDVVYPPARLPGVVRETVLTGYVPQELLGRPVPRFVDRPIDVGYRARKLPAWLGSFGQEKYLIGDRFLEDAPRYGLRCDISTSEDDRIYGDRWIRFLTECKAVLGSESGASVLDFTGRIQQQVEAHVAAHPDATFDQLQGLYFSGEDRRHLLHVISPRVFEAAALRTLLILYEGTYSDRVVPWRHFVPLRKDHSNMDEVVAVLRDPARAEEITTRAYNEVACNPDNSFAALAKDMDCVVARAFTPAMAATKPAYTAAEFGAVQARAWRLRRRQRIRQDVQVAAEHVLSVMPEWISRPVRRTARTIRRMIAG